MSTQKIALITGSTQGLGLELAKSLNEHDIRLILTGRSQPKLEIALNQLSQQKKHIALQCDLNNDEDLKNMIDALKTQAIYPNIIIHNLGQRLEDDKFPLGRDVLKNSIKFNLEIALELNNAFIPDMIKNKFGRIIHISSDSSLTGKCSPAYAAAKSAVNAYVKSAARYYTKHNVMFCAILPGIFEHEGSGWAKKKYEEPEVYQQRMLQMPLGRFAHPAEIASYITDLVCNKSIMSAGSLIELTGGY